MERHSIRILTLFGIAIRLHVSWLFIFVLLTWTFVAHFSRDGRWSNEICWLAGVATSVLFFVSVLLHELAHSVVAMDQGMRVRNIVLFIFGGVAEITEEPRSAGTEFVMAIAGPMMSFAIAASAWGFWWLARGPFEAAAAVALHLAKINMILGIFNLIPGFPLDGGRVLRSMIWGATRDVLLATRWATRAGMGVGFLFMALGVWQFIGGSLFNGLWMVFIGWFLAGAAQSAYSRARLRESVRDRTVRQVTAPPADVVSPEADLASLIYGHILSRHARLVAVVENGGLRGVITLDRIRAVPQRLWPSTRVGEVMLPASEVRAIHPETDLWTAVELMGDGETDWLAVVESDGRFVGILDRENVLQQLEVRSQLGV